MICFFKPTTSLPQTFQGSARLKVQKIMTELYLRVASALYHFTSQVIGGSTYEARCYGGELIKPQQHRKPGNCCDESPIRYRFESLVVTWARQKAWVVKERKDPIMDRGTNFPLKEEV